MTAPELKPCPFCGSLARFVHSKPEKEGRISVKIECNADTGEYVPSYLGAFLNVWHINEEDAAKAWNTRFTPPDCEAAQARIKQLEAALNELDDYSLEGWQIHQIIKEVLANGGSNEAK